MSKDGRLTIRFRELLDRIETAAKEDDRDPSDWVRVQIKRVLRRRNKKRDRQPALAR